MTLRIINLKFKNKRFFLKLKSNAIFFFVNIKKVFSVNTKKVLRQ